MESLLPFICIMIGIFYVLPLVWNIKIHTMHDGTSGLAGGIAAGIIPIVNWLLLLLAIFWPKNDNK